VRLPKGKKALKLAQWILKVFNWQGPLANSMRVTASREVRILGGRKTLKGKSQECLALKYGPEVMGEETR
jgi:hypothetical protein